MSNAVVTPAEAAAAIPLFHEAIEADRRCIEALRAPLEYRALSESSLRSIALTEERIALTERDIAVLLELTK